MIRTQVDSQIVHSGLEIGTTELRPDNTTRDPVSGVNYVDTRYKAAT
jgi:hypothetical protein